MKDTTEINKVVKPHCWGKMNWILKYEDGKEPETYICSCTHGAFKCKALTRELNKGKEGKG